MTIGAGRQPRQRNPHAHTIHQPGRRLLRRIPLPFVRRKVAGEGGRPVDAPLALVPFIDFLLVTVIFLLMSFSAGGDINVDRHIKLPSAENVEAAVVAPMVAVNGNQVLVDGELVGSTRAIEERGVMMRVDQLFERLKSKRELWKSFHPQQAFPGVCLLQVDEAVPAVVVKSVFQTAALAGYPSVSFVVRTRPKTAS